MADYSIFSQPQGPVVPIQLFPDAMAAGTNVGNAQKNTTQAIAEGITNAVGAYQTTRLNEEKIEGAQLENQQRQIELENLPEKEAADIEARRAAAEHNRALSELSAQKVAEQRAEDALIGSVASGIASRDAATINSILGSEDLYKLILKDPKKYGGIASAIQGIPGVDPQKLAFLEDYAESQKARDLYESKAAALAEDAVKAEATLNSDYMAGQLTDEAQNITGRAYTRGEVASKLVTAPAGQKAVQNGKLVANPNFDPVTVGAVGEGKVDAFLREKDANGNDVFYPLQSGIDPKELKPSLSAKGILEITTGEALKNKLRDISRKRQQVSSGAQAATGPYQYGPKMRSPAADIKISVDEVKNDINTLAANGSYDDLEDSILNDPQVNKVIKNEFRLNDLRVKEAAPAITTLYKEIENGGAVEPGFFGKLTGSVVSSEYQKAKKDLARARAFTEFDSLQAKADSSSSAKRVLASYNEEAVKKYNREKAAVQAQLDNALSVPYTYGTGVQNQAILAVASKYTEEVNTPEDLFYAKNKEAYDQQADAYAKKMQREYDRVKNYIPRATSIFTQNAEEARAAAGDKTPLIDTERIKNSFNVGAELSGSAHAEMNKESRFNAVQTGVEMGMAVGESAPRGGVTSMTREEAQDYIIDTAKKYAIPEHIAIGLAAHESGWKEDARSPVGAIGYMQLMPETAKELGVDPFDPKQNIEGGLKYLAKMYQMFGSWDLALNAYNAGPGNVRKYKGRVPFKETEKHLKGVKEKAAEFLEKKKSYA